MVGTLLGYVILPVLLVETNTIAFREPTQTKEDTAGVGGVSSSQQQRGTNPFLRPWQRNTIEINTPKSQVDNEDIQLRLMQDQHVLSRQSLPTETSPHVMKTEVLSDHRRKKIMVTGGAGFVGSHLVDKLMMEGHEVTVLDNFFTGQKKNVAHWFHHPNFR